MEERDQWRGQEDQKREWGQMYPKYDGVYGQNAIAVH